MLRCFPEMLEHRTSILWAELCGGLIFFFLILSLYFTQLSPHTLDGLFFFFFFLLVLSSSSQKSQ